MVSDESGVRVEGPGRRRVAWGRVFGLLLALAVAVGAGWWAGRSVLETPEDPFGEAGPVTYTVVDGMVGRSLQFAAAAEWEVVPVARSEVAGVVTSVAVAPGDQVTAGGVLFEVGLRPVVAAVGAVPAFRDMRVRDRGDDVAQLQGLLAELGYLDIEADGVMGSVTVAAVRAWQRDLGLVVDGVVRLGDVVFVPELPARVVLGPDVVVGRRLAGGEEAVWVVPDDPSFWVPLAPEQRSLVPLDAPVKVTFGAGTWEAVTVAAVETDPAVTDGLGELRLVLTAPGGGAVCGGDCAEWVGLEGRTNFGAEIVVVPETTGPVVPVAAIHSGADGSTAVTLVSGGDVAVQIVASHGGVAVVSGVEVGDVVVLPFGEPPQ